MESHSQQNAQGGQDDTRREQAQSDYQSGSGEASQDKDTRVSERETKKPKRDPQQNAQGGQDDTERSQPKSEYQQGQDA